MSVSYLVTGGAGFIGVNYVKHILAQAVAPHVVVLDALTYAGNASSLESEIASGKVEFVHGDIGDSALVAALLQKLRPDYVVNFAAESHVDRSISDPTPFVSTNIAGTQNLLECARRLRAEETAEGRKPSMRKFVQISTDEVYGHLAIDYPDGRETTVGGHVATTYGADFFSENTPLNPTSPYSASKAGADMMALAYARTFGLPVTVTRCSNNYGPYQFPEKLIPLMINNILQGRELPVYGSGTNVRDWLHVSDHARAIEAVIHHGKNGEAYNIGGLNERRNIDLVHLLIDTVSRLTTSDERYRALLECDPSAINRGMVRHVADRAAHDLRYAIDARKIIADTGWRPQVGFADGIEDTVRWYLDNRDWVKRIVDGDYRDYYQKMYGNRQ